MSWSAKSRIAGIFTLWISAQSEVRASQSRRSPRALMMTALSCEMWKYVEWKKRMWIWNYESESVRVLNIPGAKGMWRSLNLDSVKIPAILDFADHDICRLGKEWKCENFSNMFHTGSLIFFAVKNVKYFTFSYFHIFTLFPLFKNWYVLEISHFEAA